MTRLAAAAFLSALALAGCKGEAPVPEATATHATAAGVSLAAAPPSVSDPAEAGRIAHDRHERFEEIGRAFKKINDQLKTGSPDVAAMGEHAALIDRYAPQVPGWFPLGTGPQAGVRTDALATIWEEPEDFRKAAERFATAADGLEAAVASGELERVRDAVKPLGQTCKTCHDKFREEEDH